MAIATMRAPSMEDVVMHDAGPLSVYHAIKCHSGIQASAERRVWYAPAPVFALPPVPAPPPRPSADLPNELLLQILSDPTLSPRDLASACLISTRWLPAARVVLYGGTHELAVADARLASTLWNCGHLRALARRVRVDARAGTDGASAVGWMCLPGAAPRELTVTGRCPAVAKRIQGVLVSAACAPALAHVRRLSLALAHPPMRLDMAPALAELTLSGPVDLLKLHLERHTPHHTSSTLRSLAMRVDECPEWLAAMPLRLAPFAALRRLEFTCTAAAATPPRGPCWRDLPPALDLLVLSVCLLPNPDSPSNSPWPARPLELQLVAPGVLTRPAARALARTRSLRVRCAEECEDGAREMLLPHF